MAKVSLTELAGYHCPNCDYDVRGLTEPRCPECGKTFSTREVAAYKDRRWPPQRFFRTLCLATIPWFMAYFFIDAIRGTLGRVEFHWVTILFLAIPIQLFLAALAASALEASSKRWIKRFGAVLAVIVWILILGHIAITAATL